MTPCPMPHTLPTAPCNLYPPLARHYHPTLSIWLSVDPMSDKYPSTSPYVYCGNNPVVLKDPNGEDIWIVYEGVKYEFTDGNLYTENGDLYTPTENQHFLKDAMASLNKLEKTKTGYELVGSFDNNPDHDIFITNSSKSNYNTDDNTIYWNNNGTDLYTEAGIQKSPTTDLGHEFSHAYDKHFGTIYIEGSYNHISNKEWMAVYRENLIRGEMSLPYRESYGQPQYDRYGTLMESPSMLRSKQPYLPTEILKETANVIGILKQTIKHSN